METHPKNVELTPRLKTLLLKTYEKMTEITSQATVITTITVADRQLFPQRYKPETK
jgi:hypothetical protein